MQITYIDVDKNICVASSIFKRIEDMQSISLCFFVVFFILHWLIKSINVRENDKDLRAIEVHLADNRAEKRKRLRHSPANGNVGSGARRFKMAAIRE